MSMCVWGGGACGTPLHCRGMGGSCGDFCNFLLLLLLLLLLLFVVGCPRLGTAAGMFWVFFWPHSIGFSVPCACVHYSTDGMPAHGAWAVKRGAARRCFFPPNIIVVAVVVVVECKVSPFPRPFLHSIRAPPHHRPRTCPVKRTSPRRCAASSLTGWWKCT